MSIRNTKASEVLIISFLLTFQYIIFLMVEREVMVKNWNIVCIGLIAGYVLNISVLINIIINSAYLISNESKNKSITSD